MLAIGSVVTITSLALGAVVVQAALSDDPETGSPDTVTEAARETRSGSQQDAQPVESEVRGPGDPQAPPGNRNPRLTSGEDFTISCLAGNPTDTQNTCQVESYGGFARPVQLSCADLPRNLSCTFTPSSVVPRANGSTPFKLELSAGDVPTGSYVFDVIGRSGNRTSTYRYPWGVVSPRVAVSQPAANPPAAPGAPPAPPPAPVPPPPAGEPTFSFTCGSLTEGNKVQWSLSRNGSTAKINCFLTPLNGFDEPVSFKYAQPVELAKPDTVTFALDQLQARKVFDLNFEFSDAVKGLSPEQLKAGKDYVFDVTGTSASGKSLTRQVTLTVTE